MVALAGLLLARLLSSPAIFRCRGLAEFNDGLGSISAGGAEQRNGLA